MDFINTCAAGLEQLIVAEVTDWGGEIVDRQRGAVKWTGSLEQGYRACLWSRFSSRVIAVLKTFEITDADDLYEGTLTVDWREHLSVTANFAVDCVLSGDSPISNSMFGAVRIKDGIADQFREATGQRPSVQVRQPDLKVYGHVDGGRALLGLDMSGVPLHQRGYRAAAGPAPLKESLAAAIVKLSGWDGSSDLLDPMCGSGTLLIEAALMCGDSAPGLGRSYFGMFGWSGHRADIWEDLVEEAIEREERAQDRDWPSLVGFDGDEAAVEAARKNIARAGLQDRISVACRELNRLENDFKTPGYLVSNPPYGERLSDKESVKHLYRFLGSRFQSDFSDWHITMFTAAPDFADQFRIDSPERLKIFNGPLPCRLISGKPKKGAGENGFTGWQVQAGTHVSDDELVNRIIKNFKQIRSTINSQRLESCRVYDRDLPQYNVSVDLLGSSILITEYAKSTKVDQQTADARFTHAVHSVRSLFQAGREQVFTNRRLKNGGGKSRAQTIEIPEENSLFLVKLPCDTDAVFPVDQMLVRRFICSRIERRRLLAVFDRGGFSAVAAARCGAALTTTIGASAVDNALINMNFNRNGLYHDKHRIIRKPAVSWLKENKQLFDLIFINPTRSFYGTGKSTAIDTVKDQRLIIDLAVNNLAAGGAILLSTMLPSFRFDQEIKTVYRCTDLSRDMAGAMLQKRRQKLQCWLIEP